ncbi:MAG TPA: hypothetical protein VGD80_10550 [Kofleriaceae bacterium]
MPDLLGARSDQRDIAGVLELHRRGRPTPEVCDKARQAFHVEDARSGGTGQERHANLAVVTANQVCDVVCGVDEVHAAIADGLREIGQRQEARHPLRYGRTGHPR